MLDPNSLIGPYKIESEIGRGGEGVVFRARHTGLQRSVALKVLVRSPDNEVESRRRFLREMRLSARLRHPAVVHVLDAGTADGFDYLALEYVDGLSLEGVLRSTPRLSWILAAAIGTRIASATAFLHSENIIHRDIKPANVLMDRTGEARLADFGIAKRLEGTVITQAGLIVGTLSYLAPEVLCGNAHTAGSDLWSIGCIMHQMVRGQPLFGDSGHCAARLLDNIVNGLIPPLCSLDPQIPQRFSDEVMGLLERSPGERKLTAALFEKHLLEILIDELGPSWESIIQNQLRDLVARGLETPPNDQISSLADGVLVPAGAGVELGSAGRGRPRTLPMSGVGANDGAGRSSRRDWLRHNPWWAALTILLLLGLGSAIVSIYSIRSTGVTKSADELMAGILMRSSGRLDVLGDCLEARARYDPESTIELLEQAEAAFHTDFESYVRADLAARGQKIPNHRIDVVRLLILCEHIRLASWSALPVVATPSAGPLRWTSGAFDQVESCVNRAVDSWSQSFLNTDLRMIAPSLSELAIISRATAEISRDGEDLVDRFLLKLQQVLQAARPSASSQMCNLATAAFRYGAAGWDGSGVKTEYLHELLPADTGRSVDEVRERLADWVLQIVRLRLRHAAGTVDRLSEHLRSVETLAKFGEHKRMLEACAEVFARELGRMSVLDRDYAALSAGTRLQFELLKMSLCCLRYRARVLSEVGSVAQNVATGIARVVDTVSADGLEHAQMDRFTRAMSVFLDTPGGSGSLLANVRIASDLRRLSMVLGAPVLLPVGGRMVRPAWAELEQQVRDVLGAQGRVNDPRSAFLATLWGLGFTKTKPVSWASLTGALDALLELERRSGRGSSLATAEAQDVLDRLMDRLAAHVYGSRPQHRSPTDVFPPGLVERLAQILSSRSSGSRNKLQLARMLLLQWHLRQFNGASPGVAAAVPRSELETVVRALEPPARTPARAGVQLAKLVTELRDSAYLLRADPQSIAAGEALLESLHQIKVPAGAALAQTVLSFWRSGARGSPLPLPPPALETTMPSLAYLLKFRTADTIPRSP